MFQCTCVIFSTGVGIPSITNGGSSCREGSSGRGAGACWAREASNSCITTGRKFLMTSSKGLAPKKENTIFGHVLLILKLKIVIISSPKHLKLFCGLPGIATSLKMRHWRKYHITTIQFKFNLSTTTACIPTRIVNSSIVCRNFLSSRVCCRFLIEGFVSNWWGRLRFFADAIAILAAIPTGPMHE